MSSNKVDKTASVIMSPDKSEQQPLANGFPLPNGHGPDLSGKTMTKVDKIDALLPQTQCKECGFDGCLPYAKALAAKDTTINLCAPGGTTTLKALATLLDIDYEPYLEATSIRTRPPTIATIREDECIGCTKCITACPVDAIIGSAKHMHTVLTHECTGCGLCVEPCPVDCIDMLSIDKPTYDDKLARSRFNAKQQRLIEEELARKQSYLEKSKKTFGTQAKIDYMKQMLTRKAQIHEQ